MFPEPTDEHRWLHRMVGTWAFTSRFDGVEGAPPTESSGTETVHLFSELWVVGDGEGDMPGGEGTMRMRLTLGYDPATGRFTGTWIVSPMASMFVYDGVREGDTLTLDTEGPSMMDPSKRAKYQDIIELHGDDTRVLRSQMLGDDGQRVEFNRIEYTRTGSAPTPPARGGRGS